MLQNNQKMEITPNSTDDAPEYKEVLAAQEKFDLLQNQPPLANSQAGGIDISEEEMQALDAIRSNNNVNVSLGQKTICYAELMPSIPKEADAVQRHFLSTKGWKFLYSGNTGNINDRLKEKAVDWPDTATPAKTAADSQEFRFETQLKKYQGTFAEFMRAREERYADFVKHMESQHEALLEAGAKRIGEITGQTRLHVENSVGTTIAWAIVGGIISSLTFNFLFWVIQHIKIV